MLKSMRRITTKKSKMNFHLITTQNKIMMTILMVIGFLAKMGSIKMMNTLMMMKTIKMLE